MRQTHPNPNVRRIIRPAFLGAAKVVMLSISAVTAAPTNHLRIRDLHDEEPEAEGAALWVLYVVSMALVLLGGAFAGLTIALMGQDSIYLQVISRDSEEPQRKNAKRVHDLLNRGKHWVLVTLLLSNVIVNETLPVVLDRCFGGGVAAVIGSTVLIVIFGEILPQSVCVRYGLQIGGYMSGPVLALMYAMAPVAWPTAKLLDWVLGEDHGTVYKKSGLKTLVTLHKSLGDVSERLNQDEVTIISAVLDLKRKAVEDVMTPMDDVYTMSEDTVLDEKTIDQILDAGYSRIPIHQTGNPNNFVGMLLVKILITYDPEDGKRVRDFALATLPETRPETSCLDIINFFQEGKSHMVMISEYPGEDHGALGVVTLEDVIEELIGEEIIDESDVYVDVHRAIRRSHPAPKARVQRKDAAVKDANLIDLLGDENSRPPPAKRASLGGKNDAAVLSSSPKTTLLMRRSSAGQDGQMARTTVPIKANFEEMRDHFKHLGPSNPASNPRSTKVSAVKIKPGTGGQTRTGSVATENISENLIANGDGTNERTSLLKPQMAVKDGVQALQQSYGTSGTSPATSLKLGEPTVVINQDPVVQDVITQEPTEQADRGTQTKGSPKEDNGSPTTTSGSSDGSLSDRRALRRGNVRSGSITENVIEAGGIRKVVLEATASGDEAETIVVNSASPGRNDGTLQTIQASEGDAVGSAASGTPGEESSNATSSRPSEGGGKKKNKRKKKKGGK